MPTFKAVIRKTVITDAIVEVDASDLREAAIKCDDNTAGRSRRTGVRIIRPHDADPQTSIALEEIKIEERL